MAWSAIDNKMTIFPYQVQPAEGMQPVQPIKITNAQSKLYYVNLYVVNKAGQKVKVQVVWDEKVGPETLEIGEGEAQNISKEIYTSPNQLPNYEFQIHEYGTNKVRSKTTFNSE